MAARAVLASNGTDVTSYLRIVSQPGMAIVEPTVYGRKTLAHHWPVRFRDAVVASHGIGCHVEVGSGRVYVRLLSGAEIPEAVAEQVAGVIIVGLLK